MVRINMRYFIGFSMSVDFTTRYSTGDSLMEQDVVIQAFYGERCQKPIMLRIGANPKAGT